MQSFSIIVAGFTPHISLRRCQVFSWPCQFWSFRSKVFQVVKIHKILLYRRMVASLSMVRKRGKWNHDAVFYWPANEGFSEDDIISGFSDYTQGVHWRVRVKVNETSYVHCLKIDSWTSPGLNGVATGNWRQRTYSWTSLNLYLVIHNRYLWSNIS